MTGMIGPDCAVMCNLINTHTHTHTHKRKQGGEHNILRAQVRVVQAERESVPSVAPDQRFS